VSNSYQETVPGPLINAVYVALFFAHIVSAHTFENDGASLTTTSTRVLFKLLHPLLLVSTKYDKLFDGLLTKVVFVDNSDPLFDSEYHAIFPNATIQLGDIVTIDYESEDFSDVALSTTRFVVYNIEYARNGNGPRMTIYLSEVA
jgi:hypothetical protein